MDKEDRKAFQEMDEKDNAQSIEVGKRIWEMIVLESKSADDNDVIFNAILACLASFGIATVNEDDREYFIQLVHKVLTKNMLEK